MMISMTTNIQHLQDALKKELSMIEGELKTVARKNPQNPNDWEPMPTDKNTEDEADPNDVADKLESFGENVAITRELEIRLNEVKNALLAIEKGAYGFCEVCKKQIEDDRLGANPAATTCKAHLS
jgi:RNA polymerase-binding transcription factor DksA